MECFSEYRLFLFDFDGLLVNTEELHYLAYKEMCRREGFELRWSFSRYCLEAHYDAEKLKNSIYSELPELYRKRPDWSTLYLEKKKIMLDLLMQGSVHMMPGAHEILEKIQQLKAFSCVVTNSPESLIQIIREKNPILDIVDKWFPRESYTNPKPHPECYLNAIKSFNVEKEHIIGFEDTPRGLKALMQTDARPVFVTTVAYPEIKALVEKGTIHYKSLAEIANLLK